MQILDLSMPIQSHWRWKFNSEQNLVHQINAKRVTLIALPLKLAGCEGAPARVIALLD